MPVNINNEPVVDTGTGLYPRNRDLVTITSVDGNESTHAVEGPPAEVTFTSEDHEGEPTGAAQRPPDEVTRYTDWPPPGGTEKSETDTSVVAENKVVEPERKPARAARKSTAKKRGA
jgi:hypothetical protein